MEAALAALPPAMHAYGLAARAELLGQLGRGPEARADLEQAVAAAPNPAAARLLQRKLEIHAEAGRIATSPLDGPGTPSA